MIKFLFVIQLCIFTLQLFPQQEQLSISRIDLMPNLPAPLLIRDWNMVAHNYDSYVFNLNKTGEYLPLLKLGTLGQFNYSDNISFFMDSYVGSDDHLSHAEAINLMPTIIGASLCGIDKSNQNGVNWVAKSKDFFNLKNKQNVYLNNYSTTSGNDWWYDVMPNVYFYQLRSLYRSAAPEFDNQFTHVADRWLNCVNQLDGSTKPWTLPNMNYRAFNLITGLPMATGVPEPEAAGSIAWILYNAYLETNHRKYFEGAQLAMDFLTSLGSNPSYELQLPYGTIAAARMNAVEGTNYPLQKLLDWCFNRGDLREWGSIVGTWGGNDVSGLIGEANDAGNDYAFVMNGFQQAAALTPLPKYDKRYARAIAKWILNITNASRLFYWNSLPEAQQDSYTWASANDPNSCIPYESMRQVWQGKTPFITGDAMGGGWSATNLSLYSGSSVGYLAAIAKTTNVPEILQIDLNKTDFYGETSLVSYLYYNPTPISQQVDIDLPTGTFGVYDAITETILSATSSGSFQIAIPAGEVRLIRLYSSLLVPDSRNGRLYAGNDILDYHYQYDYTEKLRIKALSTDHHTMVINTTFTAYCEPGNIKPGDLVQFEWFLDNVLIAGKNTSQVQLNAPEIESKPVLKCKISLNGRTAEDTLNLTIVDRIPVQPVINGIQSVSKYSVIGGENTFTAIITPEVGDTLEYEWSVSNGTLNQTVDSSVNWLAPDTASVATITVKVTNQDMLSSTFSVEALVKDTSIAIQTPLIWYSFDNNNLNEVSDRFHATASGVSKAMDSRGMESLAYRFNSSQNIIFTENHADLNFTRAISLSCWIKPEQFDSERFIISHGSWQQRYKLSITPTGYLRWTVKTNSGVADLDGSKPIELNKYYHITAVYTGYSMELYVDGVLDSFKAFSGALQLSTKPITIGRMDDVETMYSFRGSIDEVKIWDKAIPPKQIEQLKNQWETPTGIIDIQQISRIYPNPAKELIYINLNDIEHVERVSLFALDGRKIADLPIKLESSRVIVEIPPNLTGLHFMKIYYQDNKVVSKKLMIR